MGLKPLNPLLEYPTEVEGVAIQVTHLGRGRSGLPLARVVVWNGRLLAGNAFEPDQADERRKLAKAASKADPETLPDPAPVERALLECAEALHAQLPPSDGAEAAPDEEGRPSANFPGLVDIVADANGEPAFLVVGVSVDSSVSVATGGTPEVSVAKSHVPESGPDAGATLVPPPARSLPWRLPRASEVLRYLEPGADDDAALFADVVDCIKRHALLPTLRLHADAYYDLCAAWVLHTHYLEAAGYSPMLAFYAAPERGKSRTGRTLIHVARRGIHTETLREANLFRDSQDRGAALFIDCRGLWKKAEKLGCEDILLQRHERGARVSRVLYPDRGPFSDTVYYDIFGPTVLASNEPLGRILDTRCIPVNMPLAPPQIEYPIPEEAALLPLRERLTAWRARQQLADWQPTPMAKPASSRLGDVLLPLAQIVAHVAPERLPGFLALARQLEAERRGERALSWEASIATALAESEGQIVNGKVLIDTLAEHINADRPEKEHLTNHQVSAVVRSLGLEVRKAHGNKAAVVWDGDKVQALAKHYAQPADSEDEEKTPGNSEGGGCEEANQAIRANPDEGEGADSLVSLYSFGRGDTPEETEEFSGAQANPSAREEMEALAERFNWPEVRHGGLHVGRGKATWMGLHEHFVPRALEALRKLERDQEDLEL